MRSLLQFIERVLLPLVAGPAIRIGPPVSDDELDGWQGERLSLTAHPLVRQLEDARRAVTGSILQKPPESDLAADDLALAASLHDLLFLSHPASDRASFGARRRAHVANAALLRLAAVSSGGAVTRREAVRRHGLLHSLRRLRRVDVDVGYWAGRARFRGQVPPPRLTAWPRVRRVAERRSVRTLDDQLREEGAPILGALFDRSPLTSLVAVARRTAPLALRSVEGVLADPALARVACYELSSQGIEQTGGPLWRALALEAARSTPADRSLAIALDRYLHLHLLECLAPGRVETSRPAPVFARLAAGSAPVDAALACFFALMPVLRERFAPGGSWRDLVEDRALADRLDRYETDAAALGAHQLPLVRALVTAVLSSLDPPRRTLAR